jgi:hypothetical protein
MSDTAAPPRLIANTTEPMKHPWPSTRSRRVSTVADPGAPDTFTRPNGKPYRPRKPGLVTHAWERGDFRDDRAGVIVFGTLDPGAASALAQQTCRYWYGTTVVTRPSPGWYRLGYRDGEPTWLDDPKRGRPGVEFTATDEEESANA